MPANPYHCWAHVADVTQAVYAIGLLSGALDTMPDGERLALLMAALCHDVEHPVRMWTLWSVLWGRKRDQYRERDEPASTSLVEVLASASLASAMVDDPPPAVNAQTQTW